VDQLPRKRGTTRERLIAAATELMWRDGVGEASIDAILERAAVLRGSLYHFFPGKGDLLLECLDRVWRWQDETLNAIHADAPSAEEGLVRTGARLDNQRATKSGLIVPFDVLLD
jgi:AcrR family transcriptional regulator